MTRKDFQLIADVIAGLDDRGYMNMTVTAEAMADALATTNPAFDRVRFLEACKGGN